MVGEIIASGHWCQKCNLLENSEDVDTLEKPHLQSMSSTTYCSGCGCKTSIHIPVDVVRVN